jgi:hypothetical protein
LRQPPTHTFLRADPEPGEWVNAAPTGYPVVRHRNRISLAFRHEG